MKAIVYFSLFTFHFSLFISCTDNIIDGAGSTGADEYKGEMVLFRAGTTNNAVSSRADAKTYYMPDGSRFVCRMYHKNHSDNDNFDISIPEDAWLKVNSDIGNSVFWNNTYSNAASLDGSGNDNDASYLYWRNRRPHAFLAWTDNNRLQSMVYSAERGGLKFSPYDAIITTNEEKKTWLDTGYQIYEVKDENGQQRNFASWAELKQYVEGLDEAGLAAFKAAQNAYPGTETFGNSYYEYGWSCKYYVSDQQETTINDTTKTSAWIKYLMYYEKYDYTMVGDEIVVVDEKKNDLPIFLKDANGNYLAEIEYDEDDLETRLHPHYYITDIHGNVRYNEDKPRYTFYMKRTSVLQNMAVEGEYRANVFDLTRGTKESMAEQPDILQALVIKEPASATLQSNRIDLYFKHQFSQVQVNIKNSEDNSVQILSEQIDSVELLGVTDEGYVFTELLTNGEVRPTGYKDVVASDYTNEQLEKNPYGTAFNMFPRTISDDEAAATKAIKSFECITFGLLQAIRITWHETAQEGGKVHVSTYRVGDTDLRNLASGTRYIWNMELRRGTLAVVRTEVIPWEKNGEEYHTDGTVQK